MDMIRWLATNKVVVGVWGLGLLAMLLSLIFGGGDKADNQTAPVETPAAVVEVAKPEVKVEAVAEVGEPEVKVEATAETAKPEVKAEATSETTQAEEVKVVAATAVAATATAAVSAVQGVVDTKADAVAESTEEATAETKVSDASEKEASADQANEAKQESLQDKSNDDLLMMAREAYWDNGLDKAAGLYAELIAREPTVIEHKGELGNVFWRQGYPKKAAELYADIAEPMIVEGNGERVSNMVGFISLFFPERATNIRKLLDAQ